MNTVLALIAAALVVVFMTTIAFNTGQPIKNRWLFPSFLSLFFFAFSVYAAITEGPAGFWTEHVRNNWGNQIWFDLLLGVGIAWCFVAPKARASGMRLIPWMFVVLGTGCIGLLAMVARLLYLEEQAAIKA